MSSPSVEETPLREPSPHNSLFDGSPSPERPVPVSETRPKVFRQLSLGKTLRQEITSIGSGLSTKKRITQEDLSPIPVTKAFPNFKKVPRTQTDPLKVTNSTRPASLSNLKPSKDRSASDPALLQRPKSASSFRILALQLMINTDLSLRRL